MKVVKNNNGVFYTPFGDKIGTVEEAEVWAGDSFNRGVELSYCADAAKSASFTADCCINTSALDGSWLSAMPLKGELCINTNASVDGVNSSIKSVTDSIEFLQKQIDVLKDEIRVKKDVAPLRAQLKTLNYAREVE